MTSIHEREAVEGARIVDSACSKCMFQAVTDKCWDCIKQKVKDEFGIVIDKDEGKVSKDGFTIYWKREAPKTSLLVQCTDSPWYAPCSQINEKIVSMATSCGAKRV